MRTCTNCIHLEYTFCCNKPKCCLEWFDPIDSNSESDIEEELIEQACQCHDYEEED